MVKKVVVLIGLLAIVGFSFMLLKKESASVLAEIETSSAAQVETQPTVYTYQKDTLVSGCSVSDKQLCAVENAVKCTINPKMDDCLLKHLPRFIFMQDPSLDRPTEMSYQITARKVLSNTAVEIHTDSNCNGGWFGLCQGNVIYVLSREDSNADKWFVKDIYAIE